MTSVVRPRSTTRRCSCASVLSIACSKNRSKRPSSRLAGLFQSSRCRQGRSCSSARRPGACRASAANRRGRRRPRRRARPRCAARNAHHRSHPRIPVAARDDGRNRSRRGPRNPLAVPAADRSRLRSRRGRVRGGAGRSAGAPGALAPYRSRSTIRSELHPRPSRARHGAGRNRPASGSRAGTTSQGLDRGLVEGRIQCGSRRCARTGPGAGRTSARKLSSALSCSQSVCKRLLPRDEDDLPQAATAGRRRTHGPAVMKPRCRISRIAQLPSSRSAASSLAEGRASPAARGTPRTPGARPRSTRSRARLALA